MSDDYRVNKRSDDDVRRIAERTKRAYGLARTHPVNIVRCLESGWIPTEQGRQDLIYRTPPDCDMGEDDGLTEFERDRVIISVRRSVHQAACFGDGRSRMTLAHELGHGVMHRGAAKHRRVGATGLAAGLTVIPAYESSEHQTKVFAPAFLIHDESASKMASPEEISIQFGVSFQAAEICSRRLSEASEHAKVAERVQKANAEFQSALKSKPQEIRYSDATCTSCGCKTLIPIGVKYLCRTCDTVSDRFQDGDRPDG